MEKSKQEEIIKYLAENNESQYNLLKASEECQELGLVLTQKALKPSKVDEQEIIDEIGDVIIRLKVLKKLYSKEKIKARVNEKLTSYDSYITTKRFRNI